jgi:hypothetical protein
MPEKHRHSRCADALFGRLYDRLSILESGASFKTCEKTDRLFRHLAEEGTDGYAHELEDQIWSLWCSHVEPEATQKMEQAIRATSRRLTACLGR